MTNKYCEGRVLKKCNIVCLKGHMQWNLLTFFFACPDIVSTTVVLLAVFVRIAGDDGTGTPLVRNPHGTRVSVRAQ